MEKLTLQESLDAAEELRWFIELLIEEGQTPSYPWRGYSRMLRETVDDAYDWIERTYPGALAAHMKGFHGEGARQRKTQAVLAGLDATIKKCVELRDVREPALEDPI